jgi:Ser/Thr protein kinase RdoA (MazF antagonist)
LASSRQETTLDEAALDGALLSALPTLSPDDARACLEAEFGIAGELSRISGERELNFRVEASDGRRYALKIAAESEPLQSLAFQNAAMLHIASVDPALPVPRVMRARDGRSIVELTGHRRYKLRLLSYLPGEPALSLPSSSVIRREVGRMLALLDRALANFYHRGADAHLIWDLRHASALRPKIAFLRDGKQKSLATRTLDAFDLAVAPRLGNLRRQVIHNDLNQHNLLRDPKTGRITGIIDFGDAVLTCLVNEVAIAAAHQLYGQEDVLAALCDVVKGYAETLPLTEAEIEVLPLLVKMRLLTRELIVAWRGATNPAATTSYRDDVSRLGWAALAALDTIELEAARDALMRAAGNASGHHREREGR